MVCRRGNLKLVKTLLERCTGPFNKERLNTSLLMAVKKGHTKLVDPIISYYPADWDKSKELARHLSLAIEKGLWGITERLISAGKFFSPLTPPPKQHPSHIRLMKMIYVRTGANINRPSSLFRGTSSPLNQAVTANRKDAVKWVIARGAQLGEQDGGTPLNNAVCSTNSSMILLLLELNADPNLLGSYVSALSL